MVEKRQVYKCLVCGIVAEVLDVGAGQLICCGQPMRLMAPRDEPDAMHELVIEPDGSSVTVRVGSGGPHPMEPGHHVQWIELFANCVAQKLPLTAGDEPEAYFPLVAGEAQIRVFCNVHGLFERTTKI